MNNWRPIRTGFFGKHCKSCIVTFLVKIRRSLFTDLIVTMSDILKSEKILSIHISLLFTHIFKKCSLKIFKLLSACHISKTLINFLTKHKFSVI